MKFIEKHYKVIIIALLAVLLLQTCKSCSKNQDMAFLEVEYNGKIDSLTTVLHTQDSILVVRDAEVRELKAINGAIAETSTRTIDILNQQNKHLVNKVAEKNKE